MRRRKKNYKFRMSLMILSITPSPLLPTNAVTVTINKPWFTATFAAKTWASCFSNTMIIWVASPRRARTDCIPKKATLPETVTRREESGLLHWETNMGVAATAPMDFFISSNLSLLLSSSLMYSAVSEMIFTLVA